MEKRIEDWKDLRYGMLIHWGLYSLLERGEWVMWSEAIDKDEYRKLMHRFTAEAFDPHAWAQVAKDAGMKYMVLTTRHHDGFSLWDSPGSYEQFTSMHSAAHRDIVREYVDACREAGLKVGFYYSPLDWRFPGFFFPRMYRQSADQLRKQTFDQVRELLTNYGKIDILWFDGGEDYWLCHGRNLHLWEEATGPLNSRVQVPNFWHEKDMYRMIRSLQPDIITNNRYGTRALGDYQTPEGRVGTYNPDVSWESCFALNNAWGYVPGEPMSCRKLLQTLLKCATGDGNLLMNVGPMPDGTMPPDHVARLREAGDWLKAHGEAVYGTRGGPFRNDETGGMTCRGNTIYVHVWDWPAHRVCLPEINARILSVYSPTARDLHHEMVDGRLCFSVGEQDRLSLDTLVVLTLDRPAEAVRNNDFPWRLQQTGKGHAALIVEDFLGQ